ncbi:MAG: ATP-binding protein [Saprospiraceae bacterium]|nr:ATP-binding protein [Saprospiraceae bacterium]
MGMNSTLVLLIPILIGLLWAFFRFVDKTNQEVATFLTNIKYDDFAVNFSESTTSGQSFQRLHGAFNMVNEKFRDIRSQKEAQFQYLQSIIENVDTGLICFDSDNKTILHNRSLQAILRKSYFPTLESIKKYNEALFIALQEINPGENKLVKLLISGNIVQLSIRKTILKLANDEFHLYSLQNIHTELENQEVESWQKLIRILTHEIMNSVAPVVSLSATSEEILQNPELDEEDHADVYRAVSAIRRRSAGLLNFTETYRQLTKVPSPKFEPNNLLELLDGVVELLSSDLSAQNIELVKLYPPKDFQVLVDAGLMEQVLINIIKNAIQALENRPNSKITISVQKLDTENVEIGISDNGPGISPEILENIFVPFFTTKQNGSGIGLSLSRQIIHKHKGTIQVTSEIGTGTSFVIGL